VLPAIGHRIAPPRFLLFLGVMLAVGGALARSGWRDAVMLGFDAGALAFLLACLPLLGDEAAAMRAAARRNDANRLLLLLVTGAVSLAVLAAIASELMDPARLEPVRLAAILVTLVLSWTFSNTVFALHYAHLVYSPADGSGGEGTDAGGLDFPDTDQPDYWDFVYFAFCLGMTFQTSDVSITQGRLRRPVTLHSLLAFVFNLGVIAFSINVLGGG
jgi:uncharacterized membrane protein